VTAGYFDLFGTSDITISKLKAETLIPKFMKNFTNKIVKIKQLTIGEMYAQAFTIYLFSLTTLGSEIMPCRACEDKMCKMILLVERTLTVYSWLYQDNFPKIHTVPTQTGQFHAIGCDVLRDYQILYTELIGTDSNCKSPKFHSLQHYMRYIYLFGSAKKFNGEGCQLNQKRNCKFHARVTQLRLGSVHLQTARDCSEHIILQRASVLANIAKITGTEVVVQQDSDYDSDGLDDMDESDNEIEAQGHPRSNTNRQCDINQKSSRYYLHRGIPLHERRRIKWKKINVPPTKSFRNDIVEQVFNTLFQARMGVADTVNIIPGFTCLSAKTYIQGASMLPFR